MFKMTNLSLGTRTWHVYESVVYVASVCYGFQHSEYDRTMYLMFPIFGGVLDFLCGPTDKNLGCWGLEILWTAKRSIIQGSDDWDTFLPLLSVVVECVGLFNFSCGGQYWMKGSIFVYWCFFFSVILVVNLTFCLSYSVFMWQCGRWFWRDMNGRSNGNWSTWQKQRETSVRVAKIQVLYSLRNTLFWDVTSHGLLKMEGVDSLKGGSRISINLQGVTPQMTAFFIVTTITSNFVGYCLDVSAPYWHSGNLISSGRTVESILLNFFFYLMTR